jgi:hypothetical protein
MISRLLLVGMVGVLGISLPEGADLGQDLTRARTGATACACRREAVTFEPIAVDDDSINRVADELNRQSEGLDLPMVPTARVAAIARPVPVEPVDVVDKLFAENQVWGESADEPAASDAVDKLFAENRVWGEPADEPAAPDVVDTLFAENRVWGELEDEAMASSLSPAEKPQPGFEPIAVVEGESSVADELNRASEGLAVAREAEPTIGSALRLTRDAAMAWLNVLTKTVTTSDTTR